MIKTARQLKDLIRNLSAQNAADAQLLMRSYMTERFLERIARSPYKDKFILKGGMLVAAMVGISARSTMDLDATVRGENVSASEVERILLEIAAIPMEDGVSFKLKQVSEIMEEAEYPGIRASMEALFDGVRTPLKIDISTGDAITPSEIQYEYPLMPEKRTLTILAYNLETVLAEKLETVITRTVTNTRMRDFYDIHTLLALYGDRIQPAVLSAALQATAHKRETERHLPEAMQVFDEVEQDAGMQQLWKAYQKRYAYAAEISWDTAMRSVRQLYTLAAANE